MSTEAAQPRPPGRRTFFTEPTTVIRGTVTNLLAGAVPSLYTRLQGETGRGASDESPQEVADYCVRCFRDYFEVLGVAQPDIPEWLAGKRVGEFGPGDNLGVALLMHAHGAEQVVCADRFELAVDPVWVGGVYAALLDRLDGPARARGAAAVDPSVVAGLDPARVRYVVNRTGTLREPQALDLTISRAVLQHVWRPDRTLANMSESLRPGGKGAHLIDLRSLGRDLDRPLDFLTWSPLTFSLMASKKGAPNRWRKSRYLSVAQRVGLEIVAATDTRTLDADAVEAIRPYLAKPFASLENDDLACLGFWLVVRKN